MLARKSAANQITLPEGLLSDLENGDLLDVSLDGTAIILRPHAPDALEAIEKHFEALGITDADLTEAVDWARAQR